VLAGTFLIQLKFYFNLQIFIHTPKIFGKTPHKSGKGKNNAIWQL